MRWPQTVTKSKKKKKRYFSVVNYKMRYYTFGNNTGCVWW